MTNETDKEIQWKYFDRTKMSLQEIADAVFEHLLEQGSRAVNAEGRCMYRTYHGKQCAASIFIPLSKYNNDMEYNNWMSLLSSIGEKWLDRKDNLINHLQTLHDLALLRNALDAQERVGRVESLYNVDLSKYEQPILETFGVKLYG